MSTPAPAPLYIGIPAVAWIYTAAARSLMHLMPTAPDGSLVDIEDGRTVLTDKRNEIVRRFLATDLTALLMLDSDMVFPPGMVHRLAAAHKDVVGVLYAKRFPPHETVGGVTRTPDGMGRAVGVHNYFPVAPGQGLRRVDRVGGGVLLIRRPVLEAIREPWFEFPPGRQDSEDMVFCDKVLTAGFEIWADTDLEVGHLTVVPVFPTPGLRMGEPAVPVR